jgi:hypothetical protein
MLYSLAPLRVPGCLFWGPFFRPHLGPYCLAPCLTGCRNGGRVDDEGRAWLMMITYKRCPFFYPSFRVPVPVCYLQAVGSGWRSVWRSLKRCPFFYPYIRGPLTQSRFFWAVCLWWDPQPSDLSTSQLVNLPKVRAKKKDPKWGLSFRCGGLS